MSRTSPPTSSAPPPPHDGPSPSKPGSATAIAEQVLAGTSERDAAHYVRALTDERTATSSLAARVVEELAAREPRSIATLAGPLAQLFESGRKRAVQTAGNTLPGIAKVAPARVAKHLPTLVAAFDATSPEGQDGLMRTFATLCTASVAYQKRLEDILKHALKTTDPKRLVAWSALILPTLKGEPHARARAVVEARLESIPRPMAQKIADALGIKLRPAAR